MPPAAGPLQRLQPRHVGEAAALAAAAFVHTPSYTYIYEGLDEAQRLAALTWLFGVNIRLRLHQGGARCAFAAESDAAPGQHGEMLCFFMLQPPAAAEISTLVMLRNGMLLFPFRFGFRALVRLLQVKGYHERAERAARQACGGCTEFASLERMVVRPGAQGGGLGSRCLGAALAEAAADGQAVVLGTQSARNVKFYSRLGFEEVGQDSRYFATASSSGESNWMMVKRPPKPAASRAVAASGTTMYALQQLVPVLVLLLLLIAVCAVLGRGLGFF